MPISRFSCNGAAMQQGNLPYKRKPKAYAAHLPASGFIYPEKGLEHTCPILLRDAAACVCNTQHSAAFLLSDRDMHRTAGGIVFDAVFNQIIAIFNNTAESTLTFEKKLSLIHI